MTPPCANANPLALSEKPSYCLFPNGTSFMAWEDRNCSRCWKRAGENINGRNHNCSIESNIALSAAFDGSLMHMGEKRAERLAKRLNWDGMDYLETDCPEREEKRPPRPRAAKQTNEPTLL